MDNLILTLVERLIESTTRTLTAENKLAEIEAQLNRALDELNNAKGQIIALNAKIESLNNDIDIKNDTIVRGYNKRMELEKKVADLETKIKGDTDAEA